MGKLWQSRELASLPRLTARSIPPLSHLAEACYTLDVVWSLQKPTEKNGSQIGVTNEPSYRLWLGNVPTGALPRHQCCPGGSGLAGASRSLARAIPVPL